MQRKNLILFILVLGTLMGALDSTVVLLAFPTITKSLNSDLITTIWIIIIYLLVLAVTTTQLGRLGDLFGRGRMFNLGFAIFTVGSALCGFSTSIYLLIAYRAIQAIGGALMQANSGAIISDVFPPNERGRAFGFNSLGWTSGSMLGILVGGVITTFIGWQYIFFINIPIGIVGVVLGLMYVKDTVKAKTKMDIPGMVLMGVGLGLVSYAAIHFTSVGISVFDLSLAAAGIVFVGIFVLTELKVKNPMIDFHAFKNIVLRFSLISAFFLALGYLAVVFLIIMYLQGVRGLTPLNASLLLIPGYVVGSFLSPVMGRQSDKLGPRLIATMGICFLAVACVIYLALGPTTQLYVILIGSFISGIGTSMFFPANNGAVMANAQVGSYGSISGLLRTVQNLGTLGSYVLAITVAASSLPRNVAFQIFIGTSNLEGGLADTFIKGMDTALYVSLVLIVIAGIASAIRGKRTESIEISR